jgi:hypothetical protein
VPNNVFLSGAYPYVIGVFDSSNDQCPPDYSTANLLLGSDYFEIWVSRGGSRISLDLKAAVHNVMGVYNFVVEVTADGGAKGTGASSIRIVEPVCVAEINTEFHKEFTFDVPDESGFNFVTETAPFESIQYVSKPPSESIYLHGLSCSQTFTYKYWVEDVITQQSTSSNDGFFSFLPWVGPEITTSTTFVDNSGYTGSPDSFLVLDSNTGVFTADNYAVPTTLPKVQITVTTSDGYNTQTLTIDDIQISTRCGPQSTTVTLTDTDLDE